MRERILILEDDRTTARLVVSILSKYGFVVELVLSGEHLVQGVESFRPNAVVLDNTPNYPCLQSCRTLKNSQRFSRLPIVVYSGMTEEDDVVSLLDMGADVVLHKSSSPRVLVAAINSLFRRVRRSFQTNRETLRQGELCLDPVSQHAAIAEQSIHLTPYEFEVLYLLATTPGATLSRSEIMTYLRGEDSFESERMIDVLILKLRKKHQLIRDSILTMRGRGYCFRT